MKHLFKQHQEMRERHKNWHDFIAFFQPIYLHNVSLVTIHGQDFFMSLVQYGGQIIGCSKAEYSSASFTIRKALVNLSHSSDEKLLTIIYLSYINLCVVNVKCMIIISDHSFNIFCNSCTVAPCQPHCNAMHW